MHVLQSKTETLELDFAMWANAPQRGRQKCLASRTKANFQKMFNIKEIMKFL